MSETFALLEELNSLRKYRKEAEIKIAELENQLHVRDGVSNSAADSDLHFESLVSENYRLQSKITKLKRELSNWQSFANSIFGCLGKYQMTETTIPVQNPEMERFIISDLVEKMCQTTRRSWVDNPEYKKLLDKYNKAKARLSEVRIKCDGMLQFSRRQKVAKSVVEKHLKDLDNYQSLA